MSSSSSRNRKSSLPQNSYNNASKNKGTSPNFNFRNQAPESSRSDAKGTRPTAQPTSVREILTMVVLHVAKRIIFFDVRLKVALYLGALFLVSLIGDFIPYPKTYLSRSDNLFNVYFVKMGWFWTLLFSTPFLFLTNLTLCCGDRQKFIKNHLPRILIATGFWFVWTKFFNIIESAYGRCNVKAFDTKTSCLKAGHFWNGFDISGHAFILIYSSLVLIEEAKPIIGWDNIKEHLRNEEYNRRQQDMSVSSNPLRNLNEDEMKNLKFLYAKYTPTIRLLFVAMTVLQLLWDIMLVGTMLYYHRMIEKVVSGVIAILTWFFTYRAWYTSTSFLPNAPGNGVFNYQQKSLPSAPIRRTQSLNQKNEKTETPKFMGRPIYTNQGRAQQQSDLNIENSIPPSGKFDFQPPPPKFL